jgi:hypothetical protein
VGIAYSRAIKNAAKKLGKMFGGSLNRDEEIESVVFNKGVMAKTDSDHKKMADLFVKRLHPIMILMGKKCD